MNLETDLSPGLAVAEDSTFAGLKKKKKKKQVRFKYLIVYHCAWGKPIQDSIGSRLCDISSFQADDVVKTARRVFLYYLCFCLENFLLMWMLKRGSCSVCRLMVNLWKKKMVMLRKKLTVSFCCRFLVSSLFGLDVNLHTLLHR